MIRLYSKRNGRWSKIDEFDGLRSLGRECGFTTRKIGELMLSLKSFQKIQWTDRGGKEYRMERVKTKDV